jgi:hypothetical protein
MKKDVRRLVVIIAVLGVGAPASAADRHVPSQYSTIQAAYNACSAGDTVIVANGTYNERLQFTKSGTAGSPITVQAATDWGAVIDAQNLQVPVGVVIYMDGSYNVVQGFDIKNGYKGGIEIAGSHNQIIRCNIHHNGATFVSTSLGAYGVFSADTTTDNSYIANYVHNNGRISLGSNLDHGLYLCGDNELVMNNLIVTNCAFGIQVRGSGTVTNMQIYNNTIVLNRNRSGLLLWQTVDGVDIANNIFYGNAGYGIKTSECDGSGVQIRNNLFYANRDGTWNMTNDLSTVSYTLSGNITNSAPLFVNNASDWHLQSGSPAIDAGVTLSIVPDDYDGVTRPQGAAYDMGAYER